MKNNSVVFLTDHKENHTRLIDMLEVNTNLSVCSFAADSWVDVDFYSNNNICFVIDEMPQDKNAIWIISKLSEDGLFAEVPVLFTSYNAMYEFDKSGFASFAYDILPDPLNHRYITLHRFVQNVYLIRLISLKSKILKCRQ